MFKRYFIPNLIGTCKQYFIALISLLISLSVLKMYTPNNR